MKDRLFRFALSVAVFAAFPGLAFAQERGIDQRIDEAFQPVASWWEWLVFYPMPLPAPLNIPIVLYLLIGGALFFTIAFGFVNIRRFGLAINVVRGMAAYVSGRIAKLAPDAVRLETPGAIVGVRGTTIAISASAR